MGFRRRLIWALALAGLALFLIWFFQPRTSQVPILLPQNQSFMDVYGKRIDTASFKDKIVILNFFTTWCPYCREEIHELKTVRETFSSDKVLILGLTVDPSESIFKIKKYIEGQGISYPVLPPDPDVFMHFGFNGGGIPVTLIFNRQGKLQENWVGFRAFSDFKKAIASSK